MTDVRSVPTEAFAAPAADSSGDATPSWRNRADLIIGLVLVVVVAITALVMFTNGDDDDFSSPLYVLPAAGTAMAVSDPAVTQPADQPGTAEQFATTGRLYGIADGDGYIELRSIVGYAESPLAGRDWRAWDSPWGPAFVIDDDVATVAHEQLRYSDTDAEWTTAGWAVATSPDNLVHAQDLIGATNYQGGVEITYQGSYDLDVVAVFDELDDTELHSTSMLLTSPDGDEFTVETSTSKSPLFDAASFATRVEPVDINDHSGWIVTSEVDDVPKVEVRWSPADSRVVAVRSDASAEATVAAARTLEQTDESTWHAAFEN